MNNIENISVEELKARCEALEKQNAELIIRNRWLEEQVRLAKYKRFGSSSERTADNQLHLFNEVEAESKDVPEPPTTTIPEHQRRKKQKGAREIVLKDLPQETIEYHLPEEEQICSCCGGPLHVMGTETRQELKVIPAQIIVVNHVRDIYSCRHCEKNEETTPIETVPMPAPPIPKSFASPSILAYIMSQKYVEGLPLYRQEHLWERFGVELSRQTMANWMIMVCDKWLLPVYEYMHEILITSDILYADETTLQVINEFGRDAHQKSYMWLYRTGREGPPIILFDYQPTRAAEHPAKFLAGFSGYLHTDGYEAYEKLTNITLVGCWSHARRYFAEALSVLPSKERTNGTTASHQGLQFCNTLFAIESSLRNATPKERYEARIDKSAPLLIDFRKWLLIQQEEALPKSLLGKAVNYCLNQWHKLVNFLLDGRLELDNNRSERAIKPFVLGRKNWLFSYTSKGARSSAIAYSIVETAKENNLNPMNYLTYLFEKLPNIDITDKTALAELMPWSQTLPASCRVPAVPTAVINNK
jgi:transposase